MKKNGKLTKSEKSGLKGMRATKNVFILVHDTATVVFRPASYNGEASKANFVEVAIAYCNEKDKFRKKTGEYIALSRLFNGIYITMSKADLTALYYS